MQLPSEPVQRLIGTENYLVPQAVVVRGLAYIIDAFTVVAAALVYLELTQFQLTTSNLLLFQLVFIGALSVYRFVWEGALGWTPGKRLMQLTVVRTDGSPCGWTAALLRNILLPLDMQPVMGLFGIVSMATGFRRQRIGDRAAGTLVVRALPLPMVPLPYVPADQEARRCGTCGTLQPAGQQVCGRCGGRMSTPPHPPQPPHRREPAAGRPSDVAQAWRAATAAGRARAAGPQADHSAGRFTRELRSDDDATRLTAARETLLEGSRADVTLLAKLVADWDAEEQEFVVNVSRTLLGWRPRVVLTALGRHADESLAAEANEALETVLKNTAADRGTRPAAHVDSVEAEVAEENAAQADFTDDKSQ
jgi:uncharacterized RDD family membrane protein YckC